MNSSESQERDGPQEPVDTRFKGFRDTSSRDQHLRWRQRREEEIAEEEGDDGGDTDVPENESSSAEDAHAEDTGTEFEGGGDRWDTVVGLYDDGNRKRARQEATRLAMKERKFLTVRRSEELYVLNPETITYQFAGPQVLRALLVDRLGVHYTRREAREIESRIKAQTYIDGFGTAEAIPLANGDLSVRPLQLMDPSRERYFLVRSGARWDPEAQCPAFRDFLRQAVPSDTDRRLLQEYTGYCLMHWARPYRRALLLAGPKGSGRILLLKALQAILPWCASVAPSRLSKDRSGPPRLQGPWANLQSEISPSDLTGMRLLSEFASGGPNYSDRTQIGQAKRSDGSVATTKHVFTMNELPPLEVEDTFYRRILLVRCPQRLSSEEIGQNLAEKWIDERDGILRWAVEGLQRILENGGFTSERSPDKTHQRWEGVGGPIQRFKAGLLKVTGDPQDVVAKKKLYRMYRTYCKREELLAATQQEFTRTLTNDPQVESAKRTPEPGGDQVRCYVGVKPR